VIQEYGWMPPLDLSASCREQGAHGPEIARLLLDRLAVPVDWRRSRARGVVRQRAPGSRDRRRKLLESDKAEDLLRASLHLVLSCRKHSFISPRTGSTP
jgi:hypothetical protein